MHGNGNRKFRSPAKAGVYFSVPETADRWVPAFAGKRNAVECSR
jgi:hypothetical protein